MLDDPLGERRGVRFIAMPPPLAFVTVEAGLIPANLNRCDYFFTSASSTLDDVSAWSAMSYSSDAGSSSA